jgi:intein/homing endonuclease
MIWSRKDLFVDDLVKNNQGFQILTDMGWSNFDGLLIKGRKETLTLRLERTEIILTPDHGIFLNNTTKVEAQTLKPGQRVITAQGLQKVVYIGLNKDEDVYDLLNVGENKRFFANDILCSNCEFIINDETLIAPAKLLDLTGRDPIHKTGQVRWYEPIQKDRVYVVALDPSLGTGGDPAALQIFEANSTKQVGEWRHNRTPIPEQIRILSEVCKYLNETVKDPKSIYYSLENNTIGEAALISLAEFGEEKIEGYFLSDQSSNTTRRFRKGFNTTHKNKLSACAKLKHLIESGRMTISSRALIGELKTFVAANLSYAAKIGETDDLVMATILAVRMMQTLQNYYSDLDTQMKDHGDEIIGPMPFIAVSH